MEYKYKVSVVMAVYNVEAYLREAIDSIVEQDIGFENIQLILVDDGSPDGSGAICDEYAAKYPDNILAIHKENGGVSSARNEGLKHVQGQYVNFLDSDDKLAENAIQVVCKFFDANYEKTDLVSFRPEFFDGKKGEHILNIKFKKGERVIDLDREWANTSQLFINSTLIKSECLKGLCFDSRLAYAEDAQLVQKILSNKFTLGVCPDAIYWYRIRSSGEQSAIQAAQGRKGWYSQYLKYFQLHTVEYYMQKVGYVPRFVQNTLMYDLQWRIRQERIPEGVLSELEKQEYRDLFAKALSYIEDDVIFAQKSIYREHQMLALMMKYGKNPIVYNRENDICYGFGNDVRFKFSDSIITLEFVELSKECCLLEGKLSTILDFGESIKLYALVNNKPYECDIIGRRIPTVTFEEEMVNHTVFKVAIPLHSSCDTQVYFFCSTSLSKIEMKNVRFGPFFPISSQYSTSYFASGNWMMESLKGGIHLMPCKSGLKRRREYAFLREIWTKREFGSRNAVLARCIVHILRPFKCKPFWLISDRTGKAGDNGEAFFRYICQEHPEIDVRFAIAQDSDDYDKLRKVGRVVNFNSRWYKICVLLSDYIVSSAGEVHVYNPFNGYSNPYKDMLATNKFVFLQHGTIIHDLSNWLGRWNKNLTGFVTSAIPENRSILEGNYEYTDKQVWLTGLPRFDRLYNAEEKLITIMPTWRKYLLENWNAHTDMWQLRHGAENSVYVQFYNNLLNHPRLLSAAEKNGYKIQFLPHISMQAHLKIYQKNSQVKFIGRESSYRDIYAKSKLVVTDYSSAVSDFAYMRKPVLYAQFDRDEFYSGGQMYTEGYFDYEKDGFGEVEYDLESTVDRIIEYMENGCQLKDKYRRRIDDFFAYGDKNNSQRVYEKIMELDANR